MAIIGIAPAALGALIFWLTRLRHRICCPAVTGGHKLASQTATTVPTTSSHAELGQLMQADVVPGCAFSEKQLKQLRLVGSKNQHHHVHNAINVQPNVQTARSQLQEECDRRKLNKLIHRRRVYSIEYPRKSLTLETVVGEGNFGQVWKARLSTSTGQLTPSAYPVVAVKTNKLVANKQPSAQDDDMSDLLQELDVMLQLSRQHVNVINLLGCCTETGELVLEMLEEGDRKQVTRWSAFTCKVGRKRSLFVSCFTYFSSC